ncbi:DUF2334 domain-containing protein [bacterium]|nr:DUF2334 domain-containing protein [bacterium]
MKKFKKRIILYGTGFFLILVGIYLGINLSRKIVTEAEIKKYARHPSLKPQMKKTIAVRFDPSFYYKGKRPSKLAEELAQRWEENGVNMVFYRAYDPSYGAFYRTNYQHNKEGEYGKYNLLKHVLRECEKRQIRVWAWFPVLNHRGAWEAHPEWREKTREGKDYSASGLRFPLCSRKKEVQKWWYGFLGDFLKRYPGIEGIDLAEPVVSWNEGEVCFCEECREAYEEGKEVKTSQIRSQPLTHLLTQSTSLIHRMEKKVSLTFVLSAYPRGEIFTLEEMRDLSGFDLSAVLSSEKREQPDVIIPEILWQEWKSRYAEESSDLFSPQWTEKAYQEFIKNIDVPLEVMVHLEATDFPGVPVSSADMEASLKSALKGGAWGVDIYSSHQLDEKKAWSVLPRFKNRVKEKSCLVLYDPQSDRSDAVQIGELLRHFKTHVTLLSLESYSKGVMNRYDNVFYVGTDGGSEIPPELAEDLLSLETRFCWMGFNIDSLLSDKPVSQKLGLQYVQSTKNPDSQIVYKDVVLPKEDPWVNVVKITNKSRCRVLAWAQKDQSKVPYAVRSGRRFWYLADIPSSYAVEGGRHLVFADILHDILNEDHMERHQALVRIEDVHPLSNPEDLKNIADYLHRKKIPFQVSFIPFYIHPEQNINVSISEKPQFIQALKYMVKRGGTLVLHGITHQRYGESTTDYEFWDPVSNSAVEGQTRETLKGRIERGLKECWAQGIYPLAWETPHYAASQKFYSVIGDMFSLSMERRQAVNKKGTDQYFPYLISPDRFGQIIIPENMGYVPVEDPRADVITNRSKNMKVVRDGVASFFFHPFVDLKVLRNIVKDMEDQGYVFTNCSGLPVKVKTSFGLLTNRSGKIHFETSTLSGEEEKLAFPGIIRNQEKVVADSRGVFEKKIDLSLEELYSIHFIDPLELAELREKGEKDRGEPPKPKSSLLQNVSSYRGEPCRVPRPMILVAPGAEGSLQNEISSFEWILKMIGVEPHKVDVEKFSEIPPRCNLLIIPSASSSELNSRQVEIIMDALESGKVSLITSGFSNLSDELGIEKTQKKMEVRSIVDNYYPNVEVNWPKRESVHFFEAPGDSNFIYQDKGTQKPLVVSASAGNGQYMFLGTLLDPNTEKGISRFPYFLSHVFNTFQFFPLIRGSGAEVYFNPAERMDIDVEKLVKYWSRSGVKIIHTAGWQVFPEWTYDYKRLIRNAHGHGMLVYAWLEPPYVNDKFWNDHPEWREKNALGEDTVVDGWRKPMALGDPEVLQGALQEWKRILQSYNWDGVTINRVGFEAEGKNPQDYTPFYASVRERFKEKHGFDPLSLFDPSSEFYWKKDPQSFRQFESFRSTLAFDYVKALLEMLEEVKSSKKSYLEVILSYDEGRKNSGLKLEEIKDLKRKFGFQLQLLPEKDPWSLPEEEFDLIQLSVSPSGKKSFIPQAPTSYPTGTAFYNQIHKFIHNHQRFTLFSENSLYEIDTKMLPFVFASQSSEKWTDEGLVLHSIHSGEILFSDETLDHVWIDGNPAGSFYKNHLIIPVGEHLLTPQKESSQRLKSETRITHFSGDLLKSEANRKGIEIEYRADKRVVLVLNEKPRSIQVLEEWSQIEPQKSSQGWSILLPRGEHSVSIKTKGTFKLILNFLSLTLSNAIVIISAVAITALLVIFTVVQIRRKFR